MVKYRNQKIKPLVILTFSLLTLAVIALALYLSKYIVSWKYEGLLYTLALSGIALAFHMLGKRNEYLYIFAWGLNSIGIGLGISSYYLHIATEPKPAELAAASVSAILLAALCLLLYKLPNAKKTLLIIFAAITLLLAIASVVLWIINGAVFFSFSFFCLLEAAVWLCVCGLTVGVPKRHVLRDISFGGFGIAITASVVVLALISDDGSALELLDGAEIFGTTKKKRK